MKNESLFYAGILGPLLFLLNDIIGNIITPDYSFLINAVSELTQAGSENVLLLSSLFLLSAIMTIVFGIGLLKTFKGGRSRLLTIGSIIIIITASFNALTGTIFPMDPFGAEMTFAGMMHIALVGLSAVMVMVMIVMFGIGLDREKKWKSFKIYSIITVIVMIAAGAMTPVLMDNNIPLLGLFERIVIYTYLLWFSLLAIKLIRG